MTQIESRPQRKGPESAVGLQKHKRTATDIRHRIAHPPGRSGVSWTATACATRSTRASATASRRRSPLPVRPPRQFKKIQNLGSSPTRLAPKESDYFDLIPDDDQKMIVETVSEFAAEILRPAAHDADAAVTYPADLIAKAAELGITSLNIPENFDGIAEHRSTVTGALVAEALAYGDMGLALPILAPSGVAAALTHWGSAEQQATYLPEFAGENVPQASVVITEPHALFDPTALKTTAVRTPGGYRLSGVKSLVPAAGSAELFIIAAQLNGKPALFIVEASAEGRDRGGRSVDGRACRRAGPGRPRQRRGAAAQPPR